MNTYSHPACIRLLAVTCASLLLAPPAALAMDWSHVPEREIVLFQPGQASWEWALTERDHSGGPRFREGRNCRACHEDEEKEIGDAIVAGGALEPSPIAGKPGSLVLRVKTAHDGENIYFRMRWTPGPESATRLDPDLAARVSVMIDDGTVREGPRAGCWSSCHDDAKGMASAPPGSAIEKYLGASRTRLTRQGGGEDLKAAGELEQLLVDGMFLEYWQAQLNPGKPARAVGAYVLDQRHEIPASQVQAEAVLGDDGWTVTLSRPLRTSARGQKSIDAGKTYMVAFAVHDNHSNHRYHYVSLEHSLKIDSGGADFDVRQR